MSESDGLFSKALNVELQKLKQKQGIHLALFNRVFLVQPCFRWAIPFSIFGFVLSFMLFTNFRSLLASGSTICIGFFMRRGGGKEDVNIHLREVQAQLVRS